MDFKSNSILAQSTLKAILEIAKTDQKVARALSTLDQKNSYETIKEIHLKLMLFQLENSEVLTNHKDKLKDHLERKAKELS